MPTRPLTVRPEPAALGAVALTLALGLTRTRFGSDWDAGVFFVLFALGAAALLLIGLSARPATGWLAVPVVAGTLLLIGALTALADALGGEGGSGSTFWTAGLFAGLCVLLWRRTDVSVLVLVAALAVIVAVLSFFAFVGDPGIGVFRALLLILAVALATLGFVARDRVPREGVLLVDAGGVALLLLGFTLVATLVTTIARALGTFSASAAAGGPAGWELVLLVGGAALVGFAAWAREPGPGFIGVGVLLLFLVEAGVEDAASLLWWPVVLAVVGIAALAAGLRPAPPDAGVPASPAPAPPVGTTGASVPPASGPGA